MSRLLTPARRGLWSILGAATLWGTTGVTTQTIYNLSATNALSVAFLRLAWLLFGEYLPPLGILGALLLLGTIFLLACAAKAS